MGKIINRVRQRRADMEIKAQWNRDIDESNARLDARNKLNAEYDEVLKANDERFRRHIFELQKPMFVRLIEWWIKWRS